MTQDELIRRLQEEGHDEEGIDFYLQTLLHPWDYPQMRSAAAILQEPQT